MINHSSHPKWNLPDPLFPLTRDNTYANLLYSHFPFRANRAGIAQTFQNWKLNSLDPASYSLGGRFVFHDKRLKNSAQLTKTWQAPKIPAKLRRKKERNRSAYMIGIFLLCTHFLSFFRFLLSKLMNNNRTND